MWHAFLPEELRHLETFWARNYKSYAILRSPVQSDAILDQSIWPRLSHFSFFQASLCLAILAMHIFIFSVLLKYCMLICFISLAAILRCLVCAGSCHTSLSLEMGKQDHGQSSNQVLQTAKVFSWFRHFLVRVLQVEYFQYFQTQHLQLHDLGERPLLRLQLRLQVQWKLKRNRTQLVPESPTHRPAFSVNHSLSSWRIHVFDWFWLHLLWQRRDHQQSLL